MRLNTCWLAPAIAALIWLIMPTPTHATMIQLQGDLGAATWSGPAQPLAMGDSNVQPFNVTTPTGALTGEVWTENLGNAFTLTVTNLVYEAFDEGAAPNAHSIEIYVGQEYISTPGPYNVEHEVSGTADLGAGQNAYIGMQTTHNFATALPSLFASVTGVGTGIPFSAGPAGQAVTTTSNLYVIETWLALSFDGGFPPTATITLPASAHTSAQLVPEPATAGTLGLSLLLLGRRRRRACA